MYRPFKLAAFIGANRPSIFNKILIALISVTLIATAGDILVLALLSDLLEDHNYKYIITIFSIVLFLLDLVMLFVLAVILMRVFLPLEPLINWMKTAHSLGTIPKPDKASQEIINLYEFVNLTLSRLKKAQKDVINTERLQAIKLSAQVAHEVNQPLNVAVNYIDGCIERLKLVDIPNELITIMEEASLQTKQAGNIVNNLKNFLSKGELKKTVFDINVAIKETLKLVEPTLKATNIVLELQLNEQLPEIIADKLQIQQLLLNLIQNAIDAMQEVKEASHILTIQTLNKENTATQIIVSDTGLGVPSHIADRLFEPFITTKTKGMGMGLSVSQAITKAHGGQLTLEPQNESRTQFSLTIPINDEINNDG